MQIISTAIILISSTLVIVIASSNLDIDFASVIHKIQSIHMKKSSVDPLPIKFITFFNRDCVIQKLGLSSVDKSKIYSIKSLKEFKNASSKNKKILTAVEDAAKLCARDSMDSKDIGLFHTVQLRTFSQQIDSSEHGGCPIRRGCPMF